MYVEQFHSWYIIIEQTKKKKQKWKRATYNNVGSKLLPLDGFIRGYTTFKNKTKKKRKKKRTNETNCVTPRGSKKYRFFYINFNIATGRCQMNTTAITATHTVSVVKRVLHNAIYKREKSKRSTYYIYIYIHNYMQSSLGTDKRDSIH